MRAACSPSHREAAPLLLGAEMEPAWGSAPAAVGCEWQDVEAHWHCPLSVSEQSDWFYIDLGFLEDLYSFPCTWASEGAEVEERVGATAGSTSLWKCEPYGCV